MTGASMKLRKRAQRMTRQTVRRIAKTLRAHPRAGYAEIAAKCDVAYERVAGVARQYGLERNTTLKTTDEQARNLVISAVQAKPTVKLNGLHYWTGIGPIRTMRILKEAGITRKNGKWQVRTHIEVGKIMANTVTNVLQDSKAGLKPLDIAIKYKLGIDQVIGIRQGKYDAYTKTNRMQKRLVRVHGVIQLYDEKGYVPSGKSIKGAVEISDDMGQLKCHECGGWFENLAKHALHDHRMRASEYKHRHGLKQTAALVNDDIRLRLIASSYTHANGIVRAQRQLAELRRKGAAPKHSMSMEHRNVRRNCPVQIAHDLRTLAQKLGRRPLAQEVFDAGISPSGIRAKYGTISKALDAVCSELPKKQYSKPNWYSNEELLRLMKVFRERYKRPPFQSDTKRGLLPTHNTYVRRFGSWNKALVAAGFPCGCEQGWIGTMAANKLKVQASMFNGALSA